MGGQSPCSRYSLVQQGALSPPQMPIQGPNCRFEAQSRPIERLFGAKTTDIEAKKRPPSRLFQLVTYGYYYIFQKVRWDHGRSFPDCLAWGELRGPMRWNSWLVGHLEGGTKACFGRRAGTGGVREREWGRWRGRAGGRKARPGIRLTLWGHTLPWERSFVPLTSGIRA